MDIAIEHDSFVNRRLTLRMAGMFTGPKLLQAGSELSGKRMRFEVRDDSDKARMVHVRGRFLDPLPILEVDGETVPLGRPLRWHEYAWMGIPVVLVVAGGALGGALGFAAAYSSARVFRGERSPLSKYVISGLISLTACVLFVVLAATMQTVLA